MINYRQIETIIVESLKAHLGCEVIMANQNSPAPDYPYVSYTVMTPKVANNGTYGEWEDGVKRKEVQQIWSFTVQAKTDTESKVLALSAQDYFDEIGNLYLSDNGIAVQLLGNITCRDNLISIGYEYRNGFDVTFAIADEIAKSEDDENAEAIKGISLVNGKEIKNNLDDLNAMLEERLDGDSQTVSTLETNVKEAVSIINEIEKAIEEGSEEELDSSDTKTFASRIRNLGTSSENTIIRWSEEDFKDGDE